MELTDQDKTELFDLFVGGTGNKLTQDGGYKLPFSYIEKCASAYEKKCQTEQAFPPPLTDFVYFGSKKLEKWVKDVFCEGEEKPKSIAVCFGYYTIEIVEEIKKDKEIDQQAKNMIKANRMFAMLVAIKKEKMEVGDRVWHSNASIRIRNPKKEEGVNKEDYLPAFDFSNIHP